jgi:hypothetical protein
VVATEFVRPAILVSGWGKGWWCKGWRMEGGEGVYLQDCFKYGIVFLCVLFIELFTCFCGSVNVIFFYCIEFLGHAIF